MVHLGIIPDGNRRWCKINNYKLEDLPKKWIEFGVKIIKYRTEIPLRMAVRILRDLNSQINFGRHT